MDSGAIAVLLSSLISQLSILLFLIFPSSNPLTSISSAHYPLIESLFPLLHHFISTSDIAASVFLLSCSRKRRRTHFSDPDSPEEDDDPAFKLGKMGRFGRVDSAIFRNPDLFQQFFKMNTSTFEWLCGLLEPLLDCRDPVDSPFNLSAEIRLGIGLFRLATGSDYPEISRRFEVSEAISKFCVKQLCRVLCTNFRFWVGFPSHNELDSVSAQFETLTGLPNCCGIIKCARFRITGSESDRTNAETAQEEHIAVQIVVDSSSRILSIVAGFSGNNSDFQVLKSSTLFKDIEKGLLLNLSQPLYINDVAIPQYFVGEGDYPLLPWLLVPFRDPVVGSCEENFNNVHGMVCVSALKTIASLRNWGVLRREIKAEYKVAVAYIGACSILHNMLITREDYSAFCDESGEWESKDQSFHHYQDSANLEENSIAKKAWVIRNALATRAREKSGHPMDPSSSANP